MYMMSSEPDDEGKPENDDTGTRRIRRTHNQERITLGRRRDEDTGDNRKQTGKYNYV